jgi:hypothetical protein
LLLLLLLLLLLASPSVNHLHPPPPPPAAAAATVPPPVQAEALTRCYKTPLLLIEFEGDKSFELTSASRDAGPDIDARAPQSRLALLLLHFPRLRWVWWFGAW